ncbi:MAG: hypothetical protein K0Q70_298, partial [Rhodospirillales bacterium]|nr:hypothetical protein [Rhodospirillales bacterium]
MNISKMSILGFIMVGVLTNGSPTFAADFYAGKSIQLVVGTTAGGGYDTNGRLVARHLSKFIPGNPNVVVVNMPGA